MITGRQDVFKGFLWGVMECLVLLRFSVLLHKWNSEMKISSQVRTVTQLTNAPYRFDGDGHRVNTANIFPFYFHTCV